MIPESVKALEIGMSASCFFSAPKCVCGRGGPSQAAGVRVLGVLGDVVSDKRTTCVCLGDKGDKCKHVKKEAGTKKEGD
jgi:hypothetical protein